jgi:hypothetical protein
MNFMLDTCVINRILDGQIGNEWSLRGKNFVTDIQLQEILDTRNAPRRNYLLRGLLALRPGVIRPTELPQMFDGGAGFDTGERFPVGSEVWHRDSIPLSFGRVVPVIARALPANRNRPENLLRDGFIAEAALLNEMTLVTADTRLAHSARMLGVEVELIP